jgi:hypothetical protein
LRFRGREKTSAETRGGEDSFPDGRHLGIVTYN